MKTKFRLLILMIILALAAPTATMAGYDGFNAQPIGQSDLNLAAPTPPVPPYDPETVPVPAPLLEKYEGFFPPTVYRVTDGVYVARGYNRDNPVLIEGDNGLIIVDPGESITGAQYAKAAFNAQLNNIFDKKPVKAIIYTHGHDCHINGASVFADEHTEIIAQEGLMSGPV